MSGISVSYGHTLMHVDDAISRVGTHLETLDVSHSQLGAAAVRALIHRSRRTLSSLFMGGLNFERVDSAHPAVPATSLLLDPATIFPRLRHVAVSHLRGDPAVILPLLHACPLLESYYGSFQPLEAPALVYAVRNWMSSPWLIHSVVSAQVCEFSRSSLRYGLCNVAAGVSWNQNAYIG
jgi:hypothetical protein